MAGKERMTTEEVIRKVMLNEHADVLIHSDRGVQFTSWAFQPEGSRHRPRSIEWEPSAAPTTMPMVESFWGRMHVELLNRQSWKTRIELATAIHDYTELLHNTRHRHSALNMLTPTPPVSVSNASEPATRPIPIHWRRPSSKPKKRSASTARKTRPPASTAAYRESRRTGPDFGGSARAPCERSEHGHAVT